MQQVHEPERRNSLRPSARRSLEASELLPIPNASDAGGQDIELEAPGRRHESTLPVDERPPFGVKLTGYRLLFMSVILFFGTYKAILSYKRLSIMPTTVELIMGTFLADFFFWIGYYESVPSRRWEWFFHVDLVYSICYCFWRFVGAALGVFFAIQGRLAIASLSSVPVLLSAYLLQVPGLSVDYWLGIYVVFTFFMLLAWSVVRRRLRRGDHIRRSVLGFLDAYGLSASLPERYEWSGTVGITLGFYCGTALVYSPLAIVYFSV